MIMTKFWYDKRWHKITTIMITSNTVSDHSHSCLQLQKTTVVLVPSLQQTVIANFVDAVHILQEESQTTKVIAMRGPKRKTMMMPTVQHCKEYSVVTRSNVSLGIYYWPLLWLTWICISSKCGDWIRFNKYRHFGNEQWAGSGSRYLSFNLHINSCRSSRFDQGAQPGRLDDPDGKPTSVFFNLNLSFNVTSRNLWRSNWIGFPRACWHGLGPSQCRLQDWISPK